MSAPRVAGIILAAGKGTRMKSEIPKVLHPVCGLPMVELVARAMREAGVERPIIVIGHGGELIKEALGDKYDYVWQREQLGTGHAVLMAKELFEGFDGSVVVSAGDTPLVQADTYSELINAQSQTCSEAVVATAVLDDPFGYGRIVRDESGRVARIVEHKDATESERTIREVNSAILCLDAKTLFRLLPLVRNANSQGEYYLTDVIGAIAHEGGSVVGAISSDHSILVGVNDRWQLANADKDLRGRVLKKHAMNGVTLLNLDTIQIGLDVTIGADTVIESSTVIGGQTAIGNECRIGPCTRIESSVIGNNVTMTMSYADQVVIGNNVWVGPFAHLRPHALLGDGVKIGNFVEIKNSNLGPGAKVNHLAYIGDSSVGADTNIGAGTITCNYDGFEKHRTTIGSDVFVGSNSTLVAPIHVHDGAMIAAGSVVTTDVPSGAAAFGRARQSNKEEWATNWRKLKQESKERKKKAQAN